MNKLIIFFAALCISSTVFAKERSGAYESYFSYDLGASLGSYNGVSYQELNLGLNWHFAENFGWRNAAFSRFGGNTSVSGVDSSVLWSLVTGDRGSAVRATFFAGPGFRFGSANSMGPFVEGGLYMKLGGLVIGMGAKSIMLSNPGKDANGVDLPKSDTTLTLILGGGGSF